MAVYPTVAVEVQLTAGVWTALADVLGEGGVAAQYGIQGSTALDRVASSGDCRFILRNDAENSGSTQGWYSPGHASARSGWESGIPVRVVATYLGVDYTVFRGKLRRIAPTGGTARSQRVSVIAYDGMRDLMEAHARDVTVQTNASEAALITAVLDAIPTGSQPIARDLDTGVDTYPIAFDNLGSGTRAGSVIRDLTVSAFGIFVVKGDGTATYINRHQLALAASQYALTTMHDLDVDDDLDRRANRVRVTAHPKPISAAATDELYTLPSGTTITLSSNVARELFTPYSDPNDRMTPVGGVSVVTALIGGTHYSANSAEDGTGSDLTASITATLTPFASSGKWSLTYTGSGIAYIRLLKVIGKAVRDPGAQTVQSYTARDYGDRVLEIDMPYQDDLAVAQDAADFLKGQYIDISSVPASVEFLANTSSALLVQALTREPGDRITLTESVTGLSSVEAMITKVSRTFSAGGILRCRWGLAPASTLALWQWGVTGASEWGETTVYGF